MKLMMSPSFFQLMCCTPSSLPEGRNLRVEDIDVSNSFPDIFWEGILYSDRIIFT